MRFVDPLRITIVKPSKYTEQGYVERFRWGFMPNATIPHIEAQVPPFVAGRPTVVTTVDEYVETDLDYLRAVLDTDLLAFVGVQSHQFHRALDLAAAARDQGVPCVVIGGPHVMLCDTSMLQGRGVSFALAESELIWPAILEDAAHGKLADVYGNDQRFASLLDTPPLPPPTRRQLRQHLSPMEGLYPARGCPQPCTFCAVPLIASRKVRSQSLESMMESIRLAISAGVERFFLMSDNFNKWPEARTFLSEIIVRFGKIRFMTQCDTELLEDPELVQLMAQAGCFRVFFGVESFDHEILRRQGKAHNRPALYGDLFELCRRNGIQSFASNMIGFPGQTEEGIAEHVEQITALSPEVAIFYIVTPIPGTVDYKKALEGGLIRVENLDRFDATSLVWDQGISPERLRSILFDCYHKFYSVDGYLDSLDRRGARKVSRSAREGLFYRYCAYRGMHPMSGGVWRHKLDHVAEYLPLRREFWGFDLAPLPKNLKLSALDLEAQRSR